MPVLVQFRPVPSRSLRSRFNPGVLFSVFSSRSYVVSDRSPEVLCFCDILLWGVLSKMVEVSLSLMILLKATNYMIWKPRMKDLLYTKDLFDPIELMRIGRSWTGRWLGWSDIVLDMKFFTTGPVDVPLHSMFEIRGDAPVEDIAE